MSIKKLFQKKYNLFISWVASYALILIVPLIIGSFAYIASIRIINEEVNKAEKASLKQLKTVVDGKLQEINKLSSVLIFNQRVTKMAYLDRSLDENDFITINEIQSDLAKFKITNEFIKDIYIYFNNNNFFLTETYKYVDGEYDSLSKERFGITSGELMNLVHDNQLRNYKIVTKTDETGTKIDKVIFTQSIYSSDLKSIKGAVVISIDTAKFLQLLENLQWNDQSKVMIIDSSNNFITNGTMDSFPEFLNYNNLDKEGKTFYKKVMGSNIAISSIKSDVNGWKYLFLIPSKIYLQKAQYVKNIIYICVGTCLLLGCIMTYVFASRNYNPVKKMTQLFVSRLGKPTGQEHNEFSFLENSLKKLLDENDSNVARLSQQDEAMRNNIFVRLLKGRVKDMESIRNSLGAYGIQFQNDSFAVMLFSMVQLRGELFGDKALEDEESVNLISFIIRNVVEEISSEKHMGYMAEVDGMMVCMINLRKKNEEEMSRETVEADLLEIAQRSSEFIQNKCGIELSVCISEAHSGIPGIVEAYSEVLEMAEYKSLTEDKSKVLHFSKIHPDKNYEIKDNCNLEKERQFINCIMSEDYEGAADILDDIISSSLSNNFKSLQILKCRMFGLINAMLNTVWEIQTEVDVKFFEELNPVYRLLNTKSIVELKNQVHYILDQIGRYFYNKNKEQVPAWVTQIERFICENYCNQDLSIGSISAQFDMSVSYLSRTYKKIRGIGLLDYIHKTRLEKAKDLMNTDLNIKEIAEEVGYLDSKAMIRAFKRYEGVTPGKFRVSE